jgi:serine phosphatase RsbU (regulator of sigma subunit)
VRLAQALARLQANATTARGLVDGLRAELATFVGGAEAADDMTVLALRWNGPPD